MFSRACFVFSQQDVSKQHVQPERNSVRRRDAPRSGSPVFRALALASVYMSRKVFRIPGGRRRPVR